MFGFFSVIIRSVGGCTTNAMPSFPGNNSVSFGFSQAQPSSDEPAGGWAWSCGSSSYLGPGWNNGEPNDQGGGEDCGYLTTNGGWYDGNCNSSVRYVCEYQP